MGKSKKLPTDLDLIRQILNEFPQGASTEEIKKALGKDIEIRTLQRRLQKLINNGYIKPSGHTHSRRYHLSQQPSETAEILTVSKDKPQLSVESEKILDAIQKPIDQRTPVLYNHEFLDKYEPNKDFYLTQEQRKQLAKIGKTPSIHQPAGTYAKEILNRLLIDLSWNSSRLEGNTYSLLDTERLVEDGIVAADKPATDAQMILNHKQAIEFIVGSANEIGFNHYTILNLHAILSDNLLPNPAASGKLRNFAVGIAKSVYTPLSIPQQIEEIFDLILTKTKVIQDPFEQAFFAMVHLPYLQPFDDVNKRVSRLAANIPLNRHNLIPLSFTDVPTDLYISGLLAVYELNKIELLKDLFIWAYQRSCVRYTNIRQTIGEPDPFRLQYREQIRALINEIVTKTMSKDEAAGIIKVKSESIHEMHRQRFIETVETELMSLHEGNFARYAIRPSEFWAWYSVWYKNK